MAEERHQRPTRLLAYSSNLGTFPRKCMCHGQTAFRPQRQHLGVLSRAQDRACWFISNRTEFKEHEAAAQAHAGLQRRHQSVRGDLLTGPLLMVAFVLAVHSVLALPRSCIA